MSVEEEETRFGVMDYVVFGALLMVSALVGVYHACVGGKQKTQQEWLAGNKQLAWLPTSLSLLASFISAITLLGTPSIIYTEGTMYFYLVFCYVLVIPASACVYMPVFRRTNSLSAFEYLRRRFSKTMAMIACVIYILQMVIYMGIVLYSPALALNAVTGLSLEGSIIVVSVVCLFYTVIGGMKAIIWTDAIQTAVMVVGMIIIAIAGTARVGGLDAVIQVSRNGRHLEFDKLSLDPRLKHSGTDLLIGGVFTWLSVYGANQAQVQRYVSISTKRDAQKAIFLNMPGLMFLMLISGYCGLVAYTKYALCDPVKNGAIQKGDQILPYFVTDEFSDWPGFAGLFVSSIFSGSLSTISSGVSALAAVVLTNMLPEGFLSDEGRARFGKGMALVFGLLSLGFAFVAQYLEAVLQLALSLFGLLAGPLLGLFTLGMTCRSSNNIGALIGYLTSTIMEGVIYFGTEATGYGAARLVMFNSNCTGGYNSVPLDLKLEQLGANQEQFGIYTEATDTSDWSIISNSLFRLSYQWYALLGFLWTLLVGLAASFIVRKIKRCLDPEWKDDEVNEGLFFHWDDIWSASDDDTDSQIYTLEQRHDNKIRDENNH